MVEHFLGKEEVKGSIPFNGSKGEWWIVNGEFKLPGMTDHSLLKNEQKVEECDATEANSSTDAGHVIIKNNFKNR